MRIGKGYATLFLTFFFLTISSIMITSGRYSREQNEKLSRGYYTENAYNITVSGVEGEEEMLAWLRENPCRGCLVYRMGLSETTDFRGAAFGDEAELPPLREGRFFTSEESRSDERIVVVGEELLKNAVTKEGQKWLELSGAEYRVVGVLGKRSRSRLDSMAFVPLGAVVSLCGADGTYMVDGGEEEVRAACDAFRARWGDKATGEEPAMHRSISVGDAEPEGTERVMNLIYAAVIFSFVLAAVSCMMFWTEYRRQRLLGMWILGCTGTEMTGCLLFSWLKTVIPAVAMACATAFALWHAGILAELRWRDMGISAAVALGSGLAILFVSRLFSRKPARSPSRVGLFVKNGILTVQFALFFWIFVQIAGYYVNMNGDSWVQTCKGDWSYFTLTLNDAESSFDGAMQAEEDPLFHVHAQAALGRLRETEDFTYMAYTKEMVNRMDEDTLREHFGDEDYEPFLQNSQYGFESIPALKPHMEEIDGVRQIAMSFASMDQNAVEHYNLKAQAGRLFEADEFRAAKDQREFPVLLGAAYAPYFSVGEKFPFYTAYGTRCTARVVGILEKDMRIITEMTNEDDGYPTVLDYDIVLPFLAFEKLPEAEEMRSFALKNDTRSLLGILAVAGEAGSVQSVEVQKKVNDIYRSESLFTVMANNATTGVWLFQSETRESVAILTALMLVALGFQLFSLCAGLISKIERRMYRYSIQLLNGGTVGRIFRGYFLEIAGITLAGLGIALSLQRNMVLVHTRYLLATGAAWLILFALSCGVIGGRLMKLDMEEIMRRKES